MLIKNFELGNIGTNCYIVTNENTLECVVIDPGDEANIVLNYLEENKLNCKAVLLTHGHYDHTMAVEPVREATKCEVYINEQDICSAEDANPLKFLPEGKVNNISDGDIITAAGFSFLVIETPGHSSGSVVFKCEDCLFTGDTLFKDSCGRTDFPDGDLNAMLSSLRKLYVLEGDYEVYPGHMGTTTLDFERKFNPYMRYAVEGD